MIIFTQDGIIRGGLCDQVHRNRRRREEGASIYIEDLKQRGFLVEGRDGLWKVKKTWWPRERSIWNRFHIYRNAHVEIGWRRCRELLDVVRRKRIRLTHECEQVYGDGG